MTSRSLWSRLLGNRKNQDIEGGPKEIETSVDDDRTPKTLEEAIDELDEKQRSDWERWKGKEYAIIPHTDAGGPTYSIGDAYEGIKCAKEWAIDHRGPYLQYLKDLSTTLPHVEYLAHWMEVTCAPPKWRYLQHFPDNRDKRSIKAKVRVIDYNKTGFEHSQTYRSVPELQEFLNGTPQTGETVETRLLVVEDLSRDLVEMLGGYYDVDPLFFLSYIGDYLFHNTRDPWVELPNLDVDLRKQNHYILQYLRARYFPTEKAFHDAEFETGNWNILRRLDSDRSRQRFQNGRLDKKGASVVLTRSKTSLWTAPRHPGEPVLAILLVDPTVSSGTPLWGGYRPFNGTPSMRSYNENRAKALTAPTRNSLFEDVIFWSERLDARDLAMVQQDPRCIALPMYRLVIADWLTTLKYMTTQLGNIEWEFENPHWGEETSDIQKVLSKLSPWRRNVGYYQSMISEAHARLFPPEIHAPYHGLQASTPALELDRTSAETLGQGTKEAGIKALWLDFRNVKSQMDEIQVRIKSIETMAASNINIEESRRAVKQNKNLARLTLLASIFIPLNFTSSFLSISADFSKATHTIWLFFVIGIPLTLFALLCVDLTAPDKKGVTRKAYGNVQRTWKSKFAKGKSPVSSRKTVKKVQTTNTMPWVQSSNDRSDTKLQ